MLRNFLDGASDWVFGKWARRSRTDKPTLPSIKNPILLESASVLAEKIRCGDLSSVSVVEAFIERILEVNPVLNCVVDTNFEEARRLATLADDFLESGEMEEWRVAVKYPFLGVPFTVKDSFAVKGLRQTVGLTARKDAVATTDAEAVRRMRLAGAIPLAVTNVSELCMWWETNNRVYGRTLNPFDAARIVGGSSGGEGCVNASAASPMGLGSDIGGSIRMPCFFNGIFGHKPSPGIVSNEGQLPEAAGELQDYLCTGPMCRFAVDLAPMLHVLAGPNAKRLKLEDPVDLKDLNFFYSECDGGMGRNGVSRVQPAITRALMDVVSYLEESKGISVARVEPFEGLRSAGDVWSRTIATADSPSFSKQCSGATGGWELCKWLFGRSEYTLPTIALLLNEKRYGKLEPNTAKTLARLKEDFETFLGDGKSVFLYPTHPRQAEYHNQPLFMPFNFVYTAIFNVLELPVTHCPLGLVDGLPVGIQVVAGKYNDHLCLAVARELEREFVGWSSPSTLDFASDRRTIPSYQV